MSNIIKELIDEHNIILKYLDIFKNTDGNSDIIKNSYFQLKSLLIKHLKKEDEKLYPLLKEIAKNDPNRSRLIDRYIDEIVAISHEVITFFTKYKEPETGINFISGLGAIIGKLSIRINLENNIFFKEFEEDMKAMK